MNLAEAIRAAFDDFRIYVAGPPQRSFLSPYSLPECQAQLDRRAWETDLLDATVTVGWDGTTIVAIFDADPRLSKRWRGATRRRAAMSLDADPAGTVVTLADFDRGLAFIMIGFFGLFAAFGAASSAAASLQGTTPAEVGLALLWSLFCLPLLWTLHLSPSTNEQQRARNLDGRFAAATFAAVEIDGASTRRPPGTRRPSPGGIPG